MSAAARLVAHVARGKLLGLVALGLLMSLASLVAVASADAALNAQGLTCAHEDILAAVRTNAPGLFRG